MQLLCPLRKEMNLKKSNKCAVLSWIHTIGFWFEKSSINRQKSASVCVQRNHMSPSRWPFCLWSEHVLLFADFCRWIDKIKVANWFVWSHAERQNANNLDSLIAKLQQRAKLSLFEKNTSVYEESIVLNVKIENEDSSFHNISQHILPGIVLVTWCIS